MRKLQSSNASVVSTSKLSFRLEISGYFPSLEISGYLRVRGNTDRTKKSLPWHVLFELFGHSSCRHVLSRTDPHDDVVDVVVVVVCVRRSGSKTVVVDIVCLEPSIGSRRSDAKSVVCTLDNHQALFMFD